MEPFTEEEVKRVILDMKIDSLPGSIFLPTEHAGKLSEQNLWRWLMISLRGARYQETKLWSYFFKIKG